MIFTLTGRTLSPSIICITLSALMALAAAGAVLRPVRAEPHAWDGATPIGLSGRLEAGRGHAQQAWRPVGDRPAIGAVAHRLDGEVVTLIADAGEFDGDWADPAVVQRALFVVVEGLRRAAPTLDPHFIVALSTFTVDAPTALYLPLANDVRGIGYRHLEPAETFRFTPGRLDGVVFMNTARVADAPLTEALFLQELGHRWGVYVRLPGDDGTRLLGRDCAHWSHFARADGSAMEGNPWVEFAPGRHRAAVPEAVGYDPGQLYLMGVVPAVAVPPITLVSADGWPCFDGLREGRQNPRHNAPTWRTGRPAEVEGAAAVVGWDAVIEHEGPRAPDHRTSRQVWSAVFVLLARAADDPALAIPMVDRARARWSAAFERATSPDGGRGLTLETTRASAALVAAAGSVAFGGRCLDPVDCDADWPLCVPTATGDRICTAGCAAHIDCGADGCCMAVAGGQRVCAPAMGACPAVDPDDAGVADAAPIDARVGDGGLADSHAAGRPDGGAPDGGGPDGGGRVDPPAGCVQTPGRGSPGRGTGGWGVGLVLAGWLRRRRP